MVSSNNKGVVWLFLMRLSTDRNLGFQVEERVCEHRGKKSIAVTQVDPGSPADRAGIRIGDLVRGYTLNAVAKPLTREMQMWTQGSMAIVDAHPPEHIFGIQVRQSGNLSAMQRTRARAIEKLRLRKRRELVGKAFLGTWTIDEDAATWERDHMTQLTAHEAPTQTEAPMQTEAPTGIQAPTRIEGRTRIDEAMWTEDTTRVDGTMQIEAPMWTDDTMQMEAPMRIQAPKQNQEKKQKHECTLL